MTVTHTGVAGAAPAGWSALGAAPASWNALGTGVRLVVTRPETLGAARRMLEQDLAGDGSATVLPGTSAGSTSAGRQAHATSGGS
jgi:hypothetical protein